MITTTGSYWTTGIVLRWHERSGSSNGVDHSGWSATLDFYDSGFCDDDADTGRVSTEGTLRTLHTRYAVRDGETVSGLTAAVGTLITDARHLGITFNDPQLYYQGDGEDEECPPPPGWEEALAAEASRIGWRTPYRASREVK